ncbi:hypothetical protein CYLTODRAFT_492487 [Cylindrobasidium torrendii FP15055 ss-10]|uniref:F-box domain-containing protein n=1 Tax=Cylindrobasidium torrendii FP15055 ss-10 TaxID=1314674 RepID=A0A0D7B4Y6_9AGAR|nr:hypothetical protein CYLTODRAFT_492487 [Cylindrobasidium torrendii FP15055 ss-10]
MSLPLELWHIILESIPHSDKRTLSSIALISHVAYAAVVPMLYFDVQITGRERQERFYEWIRSDSPFNPAGYVREYTMIITESDVASGEPRTRDPSALVRMQHLRKLTILRGPNVQSYIVMDTIPFYSLPELRELQLDVHGRVEPDFLRFLSHCPALESLRLPGWGGMPDPPNDILPNLRKLSGSSSTILGFLPGRHVKELELTAGKGFLDVFDYFKLNPESAARILSLSFPSPLYPMGPQASLESLLSCLPHLKELRLCAKRRWEIYHLYALLHRLEKLVFHIWDPLDVSRDVHVALTVFYPFTYTPLGAGSTKPCLELWYRTERMLCQWRRSDKGY